MTHTDLSPGTILIRANIEAIAEGPQVVFQRIHVAPEGATEEVVYLAEIDNPASAWRKDLPVLIQEGWRLTEDDALAFMRDAAIALRRKYYQEIIGITQELGAILAHGKGRSEQPPIQPIFATIRLQDGELKIWGMGALFGDSRVQIMIGGQPGKSPAVTVTLAPLSRPIDETDLDAETPFAFEEFPAICLRFKTPGGLRALRAATMEAEQRLGQMSIQAERERLVSERGDGLQIIDTGRGGERLAVDAELTSDGTGIVASIPVEDVSATGIDKVQGGDAN